MRRKNVTAYGAQIVCFRIGTRFNSGRWEASNCCGRRQCRCLPVYRRRLSICFFFAKSPVGLPRLPGSRRLRGGRRGKKCAAKYTSHRQVPGFANQSRSQQPAEGCNGKVALALYTCVFWFIFLCLTSFKLTLVHERLERIERRLS